MTYRHPHLLRAEQYGAYFPEAHDMMKPEWKRDYRLAMDAQPTLVSTPNAAIPSILTTFIDPDLLRVLLAPMAATQIFEEVRKGSWIDQTVMYPVVERTGVVSSYGDFNQNGAAGINVTWENRQVYNYQIFIEYGDQQMERMGLAQIGYASEMKEAAVQALNNYQNLTYFFGVQGLAIYGILNDPSLLPPIAPATKAWGGIKWINNGAIVATPNEIYADLQALYVELTTQSNGLIDEDSDLILAASPRSMSALTATNNFNVNVYALLRENFPKIKFVKAVQYGASSGSNNQGSAAGEIVQLIAPTVMGQSTGFCAYPEKLRAFPVIRHESSYRQKMMQGTEGAVIRQPFAIAQMVGV